MKTIQRWSFILTLLALASPFAALADNQKSDSTKADDKACDCAKDKDGKVCGKDKDCCCTGDKATCEKKS